MKIIFSVYLLCLSIVLAAQSTGRIITNINRDWQFEKANETGKWKSVNLPHTWNVDDVMDDIPGYYRGIGIYKRKLKISKNQEGKQLFLYFEGANQVAEVFINGKKAGDHTGGYTGFYIPITDLINTTGDNELMVKVDNSYNKNIAPLSADFTFYGGIYRDVWLVAVDPIHFSFDSFGSIGLAVTTPVVSRTTASIKINGSITNHLGKLEKAKINFLLYNKSGKKIGSSLLQTSLNPLTNDSIRQSIQITNPQLWSPDSPYLYSLVAEIRDAVSNKLLDAITQPIGFRWYHFDAAKGFFLNGEPLKLIGTSRHQDYKGLGNAVPDELAKKDIALIKEMGGNFLRVAHYPQDPIVLKICDELGILTSVEIPIVNEITESDSFYHTCEQMQVEMIRQNINHPSIVMWCYMNEVLLKTPFNNDKERQKVYYSSVTTLAKRLESITRKEDPSRYTMIAHHGDYNRYKEIGLVDIAMLCGWNLYSGWYGANIKDFPVFLDRFHRENPNKPMMVTEYGADADPRIHSNVPIRFDKSVEYVTTYHQYYLDEMQKRPFVAAAMIWNLADFNSETRNESMPHINNKGLLEWDRTPKDPYYFYKARLTKTPFVKIMGYSIRGAIADSNTNRASQTIQIASNIKSVQLIVNGKSVGKRQTENGLCEWKVSLTNGTNIIKLKAFENDKIYTDQKSIQFQLQPFDLKDQQIPFRQVNILLGAKRFFIDADNNLWMPDQEYRKGSWGHIGGKPFTLVNNGRLPYGTDKNIKGTFDDPIYQSLQTGISEYRADVPDGDYELYLHFSELLGNGPLQNIPYNLDTLDRIEPAGKRIFDVIVNDKLLLEEFNITEEFGAATAVVKKFILSVRNGKGIIISFRPIIGEPILNALQIKKINVP